MDTTSSYDLTRIRADFPALHQEVNGRPLVYLDNAATTQKPRIVLDTLQEYYTRDNANVHRGVHTLSERATRHYEEARVKVKQFLNAADSHEIIFTRNATEGINLVAQCYGRTHFQDGDEVIISAMEHHANIVPWQMICEQTGARLRVVPITDDGELRMDEYEKLLGPKTKLVAISHMSNALGTVNPIADIIGRAHAQDVPVLIDAAQSAYHIPLDVQALDIDFLVFSGHKVYGPTGIGVLYGKVELLDGMPPYQGGGDMIDRVTFEKTTYNALPYKFEAGTPHIAGAIGLGAALEYLQGLGMSRVAAHESALLEYGTAALRRIPGMRLIGTAAFKASILSFVIDGVHPSDIGMLVDLDGVAIRTGHHCAQPVMDRFGIEGTARASLACYNTPEEIDAFVEAVDRAREKLLS
jgi:cysteine desulfurase/selenocysteine lyase